MVWIRDTHNSCRNGKRKNDAPTPQRSIANRPTNTNKYHSTNMNAMTYTIRSNHGDYE
jgi:hypothetical protein